MLRVVFFRNFVKEKISTKRPAEEQQYIADCRLKGAVTMTRPRLELSYDMTATTNSFPYGYGYCYINVFNRYYYVTNWTFDNNILVCDLTVDVLATYKDAILDGPSLYVTRSEKQVSQQIIDDTYPTLTAPVISWQSAYNPFRASAIPGCYILATISSLSRTGGVTYYALNDTAFAQVMEYMFSNVAWAGVDVSEISTGLQKALINPFQYIVSCKWLPIVYADILNRFPGTGRARVRFGYYETDEILGVLEIPISANSYLQYTGYWTIPKHPSRVQRGEWLDSSPYSTYWAYFYPFGLINLDSSDLAGKTLLHWTITLDIATCTAVLSYWTQDNAVPFRVMEATLGADIPISGTAADLGAWRNAAVASGISALPSIISALPTAKDIVRNSISSAQNSFANSGIGQWINNLIPGAVPQTEESDNSPLLSNLTETIKGAATNAISAGAAAMNRAELIGSQGAMSLFYTEDALLAARFYIPAQEDIHHNGRPLYSLVSPRDLMGGYMQAAVYDYTVSDVEEENNALQDYITNGIILED